MNPYSLLPRAALLAAACALTIACGDDDDEEVEDTRPPPQLELRRLVPTGARAWQPGDACVEVGSDAAGSLAVEVAIVGGELRAPGACGARTHCGHWALSLTAAGFEQTALSSGLSHTLSLADAPTGVEITLRVTLQNDLGAPLLAEGEPISDEATLRLEAPGGC